MRAGKQGGRERERGGDQKVDMNGKNVNVVFKNNMMITVVFSKLIRYIITDT